MITDIAAAKDRMDIKKKRMLDEKLRKEFDRLNIEKFSGQIERYELKFSEYSARTHGRINFKRMHIMISLPMLRQYGWDAVRQTLLHEMCHALIHQQGGHPRHTKRFWSEFQKRGGIRDRLCVKPQRAYVYACPTCDTEFERMRKIKKPWLYSCSRCDKGFNIRHRLYLREVRNESFSWAV